jgi:uncharacterized protein (TIGR00255 family)
MKSMTGYAYRENDDKDVLVSVEIKGYNNRFLEVSVYLPSYLSALESGFREYLAGRFRRGKVDVNIRFKDYHTPVTVSVNREAARAYGEALSALAETFGLQEKPSLQTILAMEGILEIEKKGDIEKCRAAIEPVLIRAADAFEAERVREGNHTCVDILSHIASLEKSAKIIASHQTALEATIKENLHSRFAELLGDRIDENRILAETAVLLMKYTISEELSRLDSHLGEFRAEAERNPGPGKKLDFLCQEINREINTIGSKATILEVSREVVTMKDALENIREQLRNVE